MAATIFSRAFTKVPGPDALVVPGHPLTPDYFWIPGMSAPGALIEGRRRVAPAEFTTGGVWTPASVRGLGGFTREHTATADRITLGNTDTIMPLGTQVTIIHAAMKTDATLRTAYSFTNIAAGNAPGGVGSVVGAGLPYVDGILSWDWAGETSGAAGGRLRVSGITFGNDVWGFTSGPRNQEVWQNGVLLGSQSPVVAGRVASGDTLVFGNSSDVSVSSDLVRYGLFYVYWRQLTQRAIIDISQRPFQFLEAK